MERDSLATKKCVPCEGGFPPLNEEAVQDYLQALPQWQADGKSIFRMFAFKNYFRTIAFVNAVAWIAHGENHHPDLEVSYGSCRVSYTTHAVGGLTENDFICAAKVDQLVAE